MYTLREYQSEAVEAAMRWVRSNLDPAVIEAATGAGKSLIVAEIARRVYESSGKKVLCLQPTKELVEQNYEKFMLTGYKASLMCASLKRAEARYPVVYASPGTAKSRLGWLGDVAMVIVDECHALAGDGKQIIASLKEVNPNLRVIGLTATPYRTGEGYIYRQRLNGAVESEQHDAYFQRLIYRITAHYLTERGFLTPVKIGATFQIYDRSRLSLTKKGYTSASLDKAREGWGRETSLAVADIVEQSRDRMGVMIFAATIKHAHEIMASLPTEMSAMVTGETKDRADIIRRFKAREIKYLVNVDVLTTGFDAPHVDVIAVLRHTESPSLLQQIIGRGLRLHPDKQDCLYLDYTDNITEHFPDGDPLSPTVKSSYKKESTDLLEVICPECRTPQEHAKRKGWDGYDIDEFGYVLDPATKTPLNVPDLGPVPAHYGRRCIGYVKQSGVHVQCGYRWASKPCTSCEAENDVAARYCEACRCELINPNDRLNLSSRDTVIPADILQTERVIRHKSKDSVSKNGNPMLAITWHTPSRQFRSFHLYDRDRRFIEQYKGTGIVASVTYEKQGAWYRIQGINQPRGEQ